ncbi:MAG: intradiol ring-cleavage dioxygenase [Chloroflexi bacterium]|nr:MAG: intradiol ring-cleavage dioxygenase [Chloroflexota bacterium]
MDNDDLPVGRLLNRREAMMLLGAAGVSFLAACSSGGDSTNGTPTATQGAAGGSTATRGIRASPSTTVAAASPSSEATSTAGINATNDSATATPDTIVIPACVVVPELTEGPFFVDERLDRSDIRSDPGSGTVVDGTILQLTFRVSQISSSGCGPYAGAVVDIWHCDALGVYSDVSDGRNNTVGQKFLRGYQVTDDAGIATFTTIYPGWYSGRAVHIHFKIRSEVADDAALEFTSQLFFDDELSDQVFQEQPYVSKGERNTRNLNDSIFRGSDGLLTLTCNPTSEGYAATFDIGVQVS